MMLTTHDSHVIELSISEWFYRNRNIAGFDNPARSLYVSIREIVENALDACESAGVLPGVRVTLSPAFRLDTEIGINTGPQVFTLTVSDNGSGIKRDHIPKLIGKMLSGTKFQNQQSRGTFGLGGSLALLYGQITTQSPIVVKTGCSGEDCYHHLSLKLDIEKNKPLILEETIHTKPIHEHGTTISFNLRGDWFRSKRRIIDYFHQTSIIVPYASIRFDTPDGESLKFPRLVEQLPPAPRATKPHPRGIDVEMLKQMINTTKRSTLLKFMTSSFQSIGVSTAKKFFEFAKIDPERAPKSLTSEELINLMAAFEIYDKFRPPSSRSLSPAGEKVLKAGLTRISPEFIVVRQRPPNVHGGHPFIIEVGVAYGGGISPGICLLRFANRIPLLYDERNDVANRVIRELNLRNYGLKQDDPLTFLVHICSTRIPYKTVGKEFIADVDVIRREIDLGFKDCLRRLGDMVRRKTRTMRVRARENRLMKYYQFIAETLGEAVSRPVSIERLFGE